jgi:hypothetical protein
LSSKHPLAQWTWLSLESVCIAQASRQKHMRKAKIARPNRNGSHTEYSETPRLLGIWDEQGATQVITAITTSMPKRAWQGA